MYTPIYLGRYTARRSLSRAQIISGNVTKDKSAVAVAAGGANNNAKRYVVVSSRKNLSTLPVNFRSILGVTVTYYKLSILNSERHTCNSFHSSPPSHSAAFDLISFVEFFSRNDIHTT